MAFEHYINSNGKRLRLGYTTGTCAALAAKGAAEALLTGKVPEILRVMTPKGIEVEVCPDICRIEEKCGICGVKKDAGDDKDATDGLVICALVSRISGSEIVIKGGDGIGIVTKPGLDRPVGDHAINTVPRREISAAVREVCDENGYEGGMEVTICAPEGREAAKKTFNERLGIEGGISIIGTTGIVEPMSLRAYSDAVRVEIRQKAAQGEKRLIFTFGNYGLDFIRDSGMDTEGMPVITISNFVGDAIDEAVCDGVEEILLIGHAGKLVKLAGGIMNTHSSQADGRNEIFTAHAAICGADLKTCKELMEAATSDGCLEILKREGLFEAVTDSILRAIDEKLKARAGEGLKIRAVMFSNVYGVLGETEG